MPLIPLQAGPLSLVLQADEGTLRYIHAGQSEVLRGVGALVRDHAWNTVRPEVGDLVIDQRADSSEIVIGPLRRAGDRHEVRARDFPLDADGEFRVELVSGSLRDAFPGCFGAHRASIGAHHPPSSAQSRGRACGSFSVSVLPLLQP